MSKLTAKQEKFCLEYMVDLNATQAAIRAGYSEKSAAESGCENLIKSNIQERIQELQKEASERTEVKIDEVVLNLAKIMRANVPDYLEAGPYGLTLKDLSEISEDNAYSIKKMSFRKGSGIEFELYDKLSAIDKLMKHLGGYDKDNQKKLDINLDTELTFEEIGKMFNIEKDSPEA